LLWKNRTLVCLYIMALLSLSAIKRTENGNKTANINVKKNCLFIMLTLTDQKLQLSKR